MNQTYTPKFQEEYSAKIPALTLLTSLGWTFLSPKQIMDYRGYKQDEVVLRPVLREELSKRSFMAGGKTCQLSEKALDNLISQVCSPALNEGLLKANERMYNHLLYGITVTEFVDGKKVNPTIALIDWEHPENNQFHFTEEFTVLRSGGVETRRPDIVCFVNGIPLAVIEAKSPAGHGKKGPTIDEGISQSIRNQLNDEIPQLFAYSQILLSINGHDGRYGTCHTPMKFWAAWREEDITYAQMYALRNHKLSTEQIHALFDHRPSVDLKWYQQLIDGGELAVSGQDKLLISLLSPERLLEMTRFFTLFDKKTGKIVARYQQVFGIKRLLERISTRRPDGGREGGVIWHTTGSGKSYTMVFLSKALILHDSLKRCRIVVVTDRIDLEEQLSNTFASGGELAGKKDKANAMATSGQMLAKQIGSGKERIIFTLIQKFNSATKLPECVNTSPDIIVLIDEGHRSQGGENHVRMKLALPN
ncbi:TPA: type I restriction endonuclease subunit R, partial [Escherichia coli]|nr:type I restriction endonuclease subunit R [Escherichia coli]